MIWESLNLNTAESTHRQGADTTHNEVGDVVVEVAYSFGDEVAALEYPNLVGNVRSLTLKTPADNAFHDFSGLVVFVFLLQQNFCLRTKHVELLVGDEPRISICEPWQEQKE